MSINFNTYIPNRFKATFMTPFLGKNIHLNLVTVPSPDITLGEIQILQTEKGVYYPGDSLQLMDLALTFLLSEDWEEWLLLHDWLMLMKTCKAPDIIKYFADCVITINNSKQNRIFDFNLMYCFPTNLMPVDLTTQLPDSSAITFSIMTKYSKFTITR